MQQIRWKLWYYTWNSVYFVFPYEKIVNLIYKLCTHIYNIHCMFSIESKTARPITDEIFRQSSD